MERLILAGMWLLGFVGFILFIPRQNRREGLLALMIFQTIIWNCDIPAFTYNLLSAPVREFPKASDLAITINYFFYPVLFSIFYFHRRVKGKWWSRLTYFLIWITAITSLDVTLEKYTDLLEYGLLTWYRMWIYIGFLFYASQVCCNWFFKNNALFQAEREKIR
ncbi:CBO0543 family protein [Paenibacillus hamazuiensis]|uniref:CBO0543 family protein n=1 Tax=Paenibacillus hamazuiensis TaxID=2936508 RepID=UPI00200EB585|nr:CBO0543 family protein [Paenibacillus hamazuiensis]